jgi:hypothetical protein
MWNVKPRVIPVIIGATGAISKSFRKYVSTIPGNHELNPLPVKFKALLHGQKYRVFFSGHLIYILKLQHLGLQWAFKSRALWSVRAGKALRNYRKLLYWALNTYFRKC